MSVIATIEIPSSSFCLGSLVDDTGATVRVETTVPTSGSVIPYLWIPAEVLDPVVATLESRAAIDHADVIDRAADSALVRLDWNRDTNGVLESISESDAIVTDAAGTAERWTFRLRFPSYESLSAFYTHCRDAEIEFELVQLHEGVAGDTPTQFGLTDSQRSLIVAAHEAGYFDVPRRTTLVELGERFGVSDAAVSQRLRRGLETLIDSTVCVDSTCHDVEAGDCRDEPSEPRSTDRG
jgi:predicted DNA binding protein